MTVPAAKQELVSICIPTYNGAAFLGETIKSAIAQTYSNIEIIINDDCSTDNTTEIIHAYAQQDNRIKYSFNKQNKGLIGNWETCIALSKGAWIKFIFQDDLIEPTCIEEMLAACKANNAKAGLCARSFIISPKAHPSFQKFFSSEIIKPEHLFIRKNFYTADEIAYVLTPHLIRNVLGEPSTWLLHKQVFETTAGFNPRMRQLMDYEFFIDCIMRHGMMFLRKELVSFRVHDQSESSRNTNDKILHKDLTKIIQSHIGDYMELISTIVSNKSFSPLYKQWGLYRLRVFFKRLYIKSCREYGEQLTNKALAASLQSAPFRCRKYRFITYLFNKIQFLLFVNPILNKKRVL